ncbi:MAG: cation:proton antiporter [Chloroflexi bacterium]|nr:cation:proton antiporter [Chloroflexota bacterium]
MAPGIQCSGPLPQPYSHRRSAHRVARTATLEDFNLLNNIAIALALAFGGGIGARALGLSPVVGYLAAGVAISPFTPGYEANTEALRQLAELGVIFLMFGVGLHFNVRDLLAVKAIAIPGAVAQISLATGVGTAIGLGFGLELRQAIVLGLAISIASTVVLIRSLEERGLVESIHGRVAIAWLIVQDIATVLFLVLLPALAPDAGGNVLRETALAISKAILFIGVLLVVGSRAVPWLLVWVARTGSRELFILAVVAGALGIATGAAAFGLSVALGAFVAGVVISETETSHQAAADVIPLREAFAVLFFVSVGMLLDPGVVWDHIGLLAAVLVAVLFVNAAIAFVVAACFHYPGRTALVVGAGLAQLGEFSFIIADQGLSLNLMTPATYNVVLAVAAISITLNPLAFWSIAWLERTLRRTGPLWRLIDRQGSLPGAAMPVSGHAVIVGYGRVGELTGHALAQLGVAFGVIEADIRLARRLTAASIPTIWGDAASTEVLSLAGMAGARLVVVAVPDENTALLVIANTRKLNPAVPIIVRAKHATDAPLMRSLGANEIVVPEYEGGLEMMRQALLVLGYEPEETLHFTRAVRDIHYNDPLHATGD